MSKLGIISTSQSNVGKKTGFSVLQVEGHGQLDTDFDVLDMS